MNEKIAAGQPIDSMLLPIPSIQIYGYELTEKLTKEKIDLLIQWGSTFENKIVQLFDGEQIVSIKQLEIGFARAFRANRLKTMIAKNLEIEISLWVAGTRLIKTAFERVGISSETNYLLIAISQISEASTDEIPEHNLFELQKMLPKSQSWTYKRPKDAKILADKYDIDFNLINKELTIEELENYILQKMALLTVLL